MTNSFERCHTAGIFLLSVYFIFNGLNHIFNCDSKGLAIDAKISNTESYLTMRDINFKLSNLIPGFQNQDNQAATYFSSIFSVIFGLVSISLGALFAFFDDRDKRDKFAQYLILLQIFDAFVLHFPFIEQPGMNTYHRELKHMTYSLGVTFGLIMALGMRN